MDLSGYAYPGKSAAPRVPNKPRANPKHNGRWPVLDNDALALAAAQARVESGLCQALSGEHTLRRWCEVAPDFRARCSQPQERLGPELVYRCFAAGFLG